MTVVFIHGAWVTPRCWGSFMDRYKKRGYTCLAPAWPHYDDPDRVGTLGVKEIADHYAAIVRKLPEPPILIGHSFGGLVVQLLLDRGFGACGIAIDSAPPRGILPAWSTVRSFLPLFLQWGAWKKPVVLHAHHGRFFSQKISEHDMEKIMKLHAVPAPGRIFFEFLGSKDAAVNFKNPARPPLLFIAGALDLVVPPRVNRANFNRYHSSAAVTVFKEFAGRDHLIIMEPGWEEVADYAIDWAEKVLMDFQRPRAYNGFTVS